MEEPVARPYVYIEGKGTSFTNEQIEIEISKLEDGGMFSRDQTYNVRRLVKPTAQDCILDIGCSIGKYEALFSHICRIVGVDIQQRILEAANQYATKHGNPDNFDFRLYDKPLNEMFHGEKFTKIMMIDVTEHIPDEVLECLLGEVRPLASCSSRLLIYTPNKRHWTEFIRKTRLISPMPGHINLKTSSDLEDLLESNGYVIERMYYGPSFLPIVRLVETMLPLSIMKKRICITAKLL